MMQVYTLDGTGRQINAVGNFFRYESGTSGGGDDSIRVRADGQDLGVYLPGDAIELPQSFREWSIVPASGALVATVRIGLGRVVSQRLTGSVSVTNAPAVSGSFTNAQRTVTNASAQMLAANAARRYLLVQNNDTAGDIFVRLDGAAATLTTGVKIGPGASIELQGYVPTGAVTAIGSIASNANVVTVEG